jgi:sugar phosphate permease
VAFTLRRGPYAAAIAGPARSSSIDFNLLRNQTLWSYGCAYFFIKLIRYSFLNWLPYYLHTTVGLSEIRAGYMSTSFEFGGVFGAVSIGLLSDRLAHVSRSVVAATALVGLASALVAYAWLAPSSVPLQCTMIALIGALLFGPDSLVSAASAQDAAGPAAAATATGFVNGVGSIGAVLQGYTTIGIRKAFGWSAVFYVFVGFALLSALALAPTFRAGRVLREQESAP